MINLDVIKSIVSGNNVIVVGGSEWNEIVKIVPNTEEGYNFLSGEDLNSESIFDVLNDLGVGVIYED